MLKNIACFGVAGNFTGHLEQAGEAESFSSVKTSEETEPKAIFPTFIPSDSKLVPDFLKIFPFSSEKIIYPENETKLQIEPECAVLFNAEWKDGKLKNLFPLSFAASNDCSIRKDGAKKISEKKNWGKETKGLSSNMILLDDFSENSKLYDYRIASFLLRDSNVFEYGENSFVKNYNYIWKKLTLWLIEKFNSQKDEGPKENIHEYLKEASFPEKILVSIGATRYTEFGERNFLKKNDEAVVVLYPDSKYCEEEIIQKVKQRDFSDSEISFLVQKICEKKS